MLQTKYLHFLKSEKLKLGILYITAIIFPFLLPQPQIVLGTLINFILIFSASRYSTKKLIPLFFLPSISSFLNNILFGSSTIFLLYLIPFISLSNFIFVYISKVINIKIVNILMASAIKALTLYLATYILTKVTNLPGNFLIAMGGIQLITALTGGTLAMLFRRDSSVF